MFAVCSTRSASCIRWCNMMFSGVFDRFPTLRMAFLESGSAWVLCALERMQREHEHWAVLLSA